LASHPKVNEIPFEPERQFAASHHQAVGATDVFVKGAPERVLAMCDWGAGLHESKAPDKIEAMHRLAESMADQWRCVQLLMRRPAGFFGVDVSVLAVNI
jgi:magnesium-transporting ATPase (P-type)